ncbi:hypothetical protein QYM36_006329 [Artemia franciscana]|uniref:Endonuclease/exonuclease/phosphatase domain-containing protein n=1 Tax=Artemia franciscana TaxID=6661 RepID=A0AA88LDG7_ARTSF|nr:hypothetical protein QYM36_006329 [Artemia franciscana]
MSELSKTEQVFRECEKFGLDIVAIQEARSKSTKALCPWKPVNERILNARFVSNHAKLSFIVCYTPANDADDNHKDEFNDNLQSVIDYIPLHDVNCIVGDLNAMFGQDISYRSEVMGHYGFNRLHKSHHQRIWSSTCPLVYGECFADRRYAL